MKKKSIFDMSKKEYDEHCRKEFSRNFKRGGEKKRNETKTGTQEEDYRRLLIVAKDLAQTILSLYSDNAKYPQLALHTRQLERVEEALRKAKKAGLYLHLHE
jgi:hypothetical protein